VPLLGRAAHRASQTRLIHVPGRAAQRATAVAQARPKMLHGPGTAHRSSDRAMLGPGQFVCAVCRPIWPAPKLQNYPKAQGITAPGSSVPHALLISAHRQPRVLNFLLGRPRDAHPLFFKMPRTSMHSYNAMLTGYTCLALTAPAAEIFAAMLHRDLISYNAAMLAFAWSGENGEQ
jgi:hypothetical protein